MTNLDKCQAHIDGAQRFMAEGKFQEAIAEYTSSISYVDRPFNRVLRATAYGLLIMSPMEYFDQKAKVTRKALPDFDYAIEVIKRAGIPEGLPFGLEDFYAFRSSAYAYLKDTVRAIDDIGNAIRLKPEDAGFYCMRGGIYLDQLNNPRRAADDFREAIRLDSSAHAYLFLAWSYIDLKNVESAMKFIHIAAQMDMRVLDMERDHDDFKMYQWKHIRASYLPYRNSH